MALQLESEIYRKTLTSPFEYLTSAETKLPAQIETEYQAHVALEMQSSDAS